MGRIVKTGKMFGGIEYFDTYSYDYVGNELMERSAYATNLNIPYSAKWEYDYADRIIKNYIADGNCEAMGYDALGRKITSTDYARTVTQYIYDGLDRLLEERIPISSDCYQIKNYDYDSVGNMISSRISNSPVGSYTAWSITDYDYDVRNRLQYVTVYNDSNIDNVTKYTYDGVGNKTSMQTGMSNKTASDGKVTNYTYDFLNRIKAITDPLNQTESYAYESKSYHVRYGLLESKTDRNGNRIKYTYDDLGRITRMIVTTPEGKIEQSDYTYTLTGAKKGESNRNVFTTYKYDELGRMIQENESENIVKNYSNDIGNNRKSFNVLNNGNSIHNVKYEYNKMSNLKYVYDNNVLQATYTYNINCTHEKLEYTNGNSEHNLAKWLTRLENRNANNAVI